MHTVLSTAMKRLPIFALSAIVAAAGAAHAAPVQLAWWTTNSLQKVFPDDPAPIVRRSGLDLAAARNEVEAAQLVLRPDSAATLMTAVCSPLKPVSGKGLIQPGDLLEVRSIYLPKHKRAYPDPLPALNLPFELKAGVAQPIWVRYRIPEKAAAGVYVGSVRLGFRGGETLDVPVRLRVWDFVVPSKPSTRTAFGVNEGLIFGQHKVKAESAEAKALIKRYYEFAIDHRISPYRLPVDVLSPEAARFANDPRVSSVCLPYSDDAAQVRKTIEAARKGGWYAKAYFYPSDEPSTKEQYDLLKKQCDTIRSVDPKAKIVSPFYCGPHFAQDKTPYELLAGMVNIWCAVSDYYKFDKAKAKQAAGEEAWWYVCCGPGKPYCNFFVDFEGPMHRALFWQQKMHDVEGLLYWDTTYWEEHSTKDPWQDIATVKWIKDDIYGDGSLMYPGRQVGVDGPVTSIRLETIRDGLEDYEYLTLLEKLAGRPACDAAIKRIARDMVDYEHNPARFEFARRELGEAVEAAAKRK